MPERLWMLHHHISQRPQVLIGALAIRLLACKRRQAQQDLYRYTVTRGRGIVHNIFRTANQRFMVAARVEESALLVIREEFDGLVHQAARLGEPAWLQVGLVQGQQPIGQERIVLQVAVEPPATILVGAQYTSIPAQVLQQKPGILDRYLQIVGALKTTPRFRETTQHQAIPRGEYFLIAPRFDALLSYLEERFAPALQRVLQAFQAYLRLICHGLRISLDMQNILPLEIAAPRYIIIQHEERGVFTRQGCLNLVRRPGEKLALFSLAVRVLGRVETALWRDHFAHDVVQCFFNNAPVEWIARYKIRV